MQKKTCNRCKVEKELKEFNFNKCGKYGVQSYCRPCQKIIGDTWVKANKIQHRESSLRRVYGLAPGSYDRMAKEQDYRCGICGTSRVSPKSSRFHVDHDHITDKVRGLLCSECNTGLGKLGDSIESLELALKYLKKYADAKT